MMYRSILTNKRFLIVCGFVAIGSVGVYVYSKTNLAYYYNITNKVHNKWPIYDRNEVLKHNSQEKRVWVTYKTGVYDVTDFIKQHPGGSQIMEAAGHAIDPFWQMFTIHYKPDTFKLLESMKIGELNDESKDEIIDVTEVQSKTEMSSKLKVISESPLNAETIPKYLTKSFITPNASFYIRNHMDIPEISANSYKLTIEIQGLKNEEFKLDELMHKFPERTIISTIMCAGNRRNEMSKIKSVRGLNWSQGAIGTAQWTGVHLLDVLRTLNVNLKEFNHVHLEGYDCDASGNPYEISIPMEFVLDVQHDIILAYKMNDEPIPKEHGFPVRVIVPGVIGARNVKWLKKISLSKHESDGHWQQNDYKSFSPNVNWDNVDFKSAPAIQKFPVNSAICNPENNSKIKLLDNDYLIVDGYALSGGGNDIIRVDISIDQGKSWNTADLNKGLKADNQKHWQWSLWNLKIHKNDLIKNAIGSKVEIWAKATDSSYNTQSESFNNIWNLRGVVGNAYHKIIIDLV